MLVVFRAAAISFFRTLTTAHKQVLAAMVSTRPKTRKAPQYAESDDEVGVQESGDEFEPEEGSGDEYDGGGGKASKSTHTLTVNDSMPLILAIERRGGPSVPKSPAKRQKTTTGGSPKKATGALKVRAASAPKSKGGRKKKDLSAMIDMPMDVWYEVSDIHYLSVVGY